MITGIVRTDEARIRVRVRGPGTRQREIEAVIDTGYTGWLTLPPTLVAALRLPWQGFNRCMLGDGSECTFDVHEATVLWDERVRLVSVDVADTEPLVGMALLRGYELWIQVRARGNVTIKRQRSSG